MVDNAPIARIQFIKPESDKENNKQQVQASAIPAFRHDPIKSVLELPGKSGSPIEWMKEPAVCGYRRLTYQSKSLDRAVPVPVCSTPVVVTGVGVIFGSYDGHLRFYSKMLDKVYWDQRLGSPLYASLIIDAKRRNVVAATTEGLVVCFDLRGNQVWSTSTELPIYATPVALPHLNLLVIATFHSRCIGLELGTGKQLFDRNLPGPWQATYDGSAAYRDPYASPVGTPDGNVIVCCAEHILCFAPDGTELWRQELGHSIKASAVALHKVNQVAVCLVDGRCIFLDGQTGQQCGEVALGFKITASPAVSGDILAVGTRNGTVFGLDARTHEVAWISPQGAPHDYTSFSVLPDGNFIATSSDGNVVGLASSDGRFLWETSQVLGLSDHDPKMDITPIASPDGSMYCASYSGMIYHFRFQPVKENSAHVS